MATTGSNESLELSVSLGDSTFTANGPAKVVMEAYGQFRESAAAAPSKASNGESSPASGNGNGSSTPAAPAGDVPLAQFLKNNDKLTDNPLTVTAIAVWAEDHEGKKPIKTTDIRDLWKQKTQMKEPGNLPRDVGKAVQAGYLARNGSDLTVTGFGRKEIGLS